MSTIHDERKQKVKEAMQSLIDVMNTLSGDKEVQEAMYDVLVDNHRTLQQSFWRNTFTLMERYGELQYFDLRNQASVELCKKLSEMKKDDYLPLV